MIKKGDLVYICSPLSAPELSQMRENMHNARFYAKIVSHEFGCRAIAPHGFIPDYLDDNIPREREIGLQFGLSVLEISRAMVVCGSKISSGMLGEIKRAKELQIPVYALLMETGRIALIQFEEKEAHHEMQICKGNLSE